MAFSANILSQNKALIPHSFPQFKLQNSKFTSKFPSFRRHHSQSQKLASISASATKLVTDIEVQETNPSSITTRWGEFAGNVSGEWDGYGADFTSEGKPIELPENVVPGAFREWEVQVFDWQTQCPTLAQPDQTSLAYRLIKLLPTVGCEADAATRYTIDERNIGGVDNKVSAFGYHSSGSYAAVWPMDDNGAFRLLELEHCLVDPQNRESRVRIIQVVRLDNTTFALQSIKVFCEQWYGPFRNGEQLGGCAIRDSAFASTGAMEGSNILGEWQGSTSVACFQGQTVTSIFQELADGKPQKSVRNEQGVVLLPKQLWCSVKEKEDGETWGEVGWLLDKGRAITSRCNFSTDGKLKEIAIGQETLQESQ